jgi:hypothetical protein
MDTVILRSSNGFRDASLAPAALVAQGAAEYCGGARPLRARNAHHHQRATIVQRGTQLPLRHHAATGKFPQ